MLKRSDCIFHNVWCGKREEQQKTTFKFSCNPVNVSEDRINDITAIYHLKSERLALLAGQKGKQQK